MNQVRPLLLILATLQFTNIVDFMIMMPLGPQLMRNFGINPAAFSILVSCYSVAAGFSGFMGAFFLDKFNKKNILMIVYSGFIIGTFLCAISQGYYLLLGARMITGIFGGLLGALVLAIVSDAVPESHRGRAIGTVMASFSLASILGVPGGLYFANLAGWKTPFFVLAALGILILGGIYKIVPSIPLVGLRSEKPSPMMIIKDTLGDKNRLLALSMMFFLMLGQFTVIPFISPYMVYNVGFAETDLPLIYLFGGIMSLLSLPLIGRAADKFGKQRVFRISIILSLIPLAMITNMPVVPVYIAVIITSVFFLCMGGRSVPGTAIITSSVSREKRGSFLSLNSSVQQLSAGLSSFIAGLIIHKTASGSLDNYGYVGLLAIITSIICMFISGKVKSMDK